MTRIVSRAFAGIALLVAIAVGLSVVALLISRYPVATNVALNIATGLVVGWMMTAHGQPRMWRTVLCVIEAGVLLNLAGLIWLGYANVWPGEPLLTVGCFAFFVGLMTGPRPLVIRPFRLTSTRSTGSINDPQ